MQATIYAIGQVVDRCEVGLYFNDFERRAAETLAVSQLGIPCELGASISVGHPYCCSSTDLLATVEVVDMSKFASIAFYNYGTVPHYRLEWIREAVKSIRGTA